MKYSALFFLILGMAFFGSATPFSKLVGQVFPILGAAGIRVLLAGLVLLPFALIKEEKMFSLENRTGL